VYDNAAKSDLVALCMQPGATVSRLAREGEPRARSLQWAKHWVGVDIDALFFQILATYNITNSIQPLLTEDEEGGLLTRAQRRAYRSWLNGDDLHKHYGRTTVWKYERDVKEATGIDMRGSRRPEALPHIELDQVLTPENLVPVPAWAYGTRRYWAPGDRYDLEAGGGT
jgi:hypothetical protein